MNNYKAVIFDVDGTLLDTREGVLASVQYVIRCKGLSPLEPRQLNTFIGPPIQDSFAKYYDLGNDEIQQLAELFRHRYSTVDLFKATPYKGIYELFETLKQRGFQLAVATYKRQDYATAILRHFHFDRYTNVLYGADNQNKLKKKDIIHKCLVALELESANQAVMIGDSDNDAIGAKSLGMEFIGVTYGFGFQAPEDMEQFPNIGIAETPLEILNIL